ncbi:MAG TPA: FG-GAP and VCBS repeat-containing protein, partial [Verrucomicrobiae bacterium]|nr:FG-GAP and VCBS repeat-containing protein [Verrucomicrobiae bacterium]
MKPYVFLTGGILLILAAPAHPAGLAAPHFRAVEIDNKIEIGYAVTVADVDGDGKPDILVVDNKQVVWYRNPSWDKFVLAENLTELDNVCIAAADINGDGKAEIAVGAGWNPGDTLNSGAVFYLIPPDDRTRRWTPVELPHEPTVHRMRWMPTQSGRFDLVVAPLH